MAIELFDLFIISLMTALLNAITYGFSEWLIKNRIIKKLNAIEDKLRSNSIGNKGNDPHKEQKEYTG